MAVNRLLGRMLLAATVLGGTALAPVAAAEPATPAHAPAGDVRPATFLHLTVQYDMDPGRYRTALLTCQPAGGTHANAEKACESLADADGRFEDLRTGNEDALCPLIYRPVTVSAKGLWENKPVDYEQTYPNACVLSAYTGSVFDL